jgi:Lhr-like helicase
MYLKRSSRTKQKVGRGVIVTKRLGCLHAHHSNIEYIEKALSHYDVEIMHFVDPSFMYRLMHDEGFQYSHAKMKVKEQVKLIAMCHVDAILMTCTNYIAMLQEEALSVSIPIIKLDDPYFESICRVEKPHIIIFTNPATVEGTMKRLYSYARNKGKTIDVESLVISDTFELIIQGRKSEYDDKVEKFLIDIIQSEDRIISVAQLSMVDACKRVGGITLNPLMVLVDSLIEQLALERKW